MHVIMHMIICICSYSYDHAYYHAYDHAYDHMLLTFSMFSFCFCSTLPFAPMYIAVWSSRPRSCGGGFCRRQLSTCRALELGAGLALDGKKERKRTTAIAVLYLLIYITTAVGGVYHQKENIPRSTGYQPYGSTMASAEGGDRSNLTSSDSGQTARFGGGSHIGDDSFAMPVATGDAEVELPAIEDADDSHVFADSCMIAENVMASLTSSMTASHVPGLTGSSESRKKSRSPPREIMDRPGRSQHGTPPSRGTVRSGASPANTPSRTAAVANDAFLSPMTRQSSSRSIRSDPFGGLASTPAEQASVQMDASMRRILTRDCYEFGPLVGQGRASPRAMRAGSMLLQLDDAQPPLPPPASVPVNTDMGRRYEEIMKELNA